MSVAGLPCAFWARFASRAFFSAHDLADRLFCPLRAQVLCGDGFGVTRGCHAYAVATNAIASSALHRLPCWLRIMQLTCVADACAQSGALIVARLHWLRPGVHAALGCRRRAELAQLGVV